MDQMPYRAIIGNILVTTCQILLGIKGSEVNSVLLHNMSNTLLPHTSRRSLDRLGIYGLLLTFVPLMHLLCYTHKNRISADEALIVLELCAASVRRKRWKTAHTIQFCEADAGLLS